ncbi:MBL fold metallo-hydrolase [Candidatus Leptofilum sp.]|uniref:MBL fold metallo-hydrolase n=1 Tax=Candidatus Leptofilum sp. TaxID=3241576 RepID=UPI003B5A24ED
MEIAPNVHWLETGSSNVYLIIDTPNIVLIDTGTPRQQDKILGKLRQLGHQPADLTHILVTHADIDHVGSLAALYKATGAQIMAGADSARLISQGKSPKHMPIIAQWIIDTFMKYGAVPQDKISVLKDGETLPFLSGLQVLATPGHTLDHFSFFGPATGILFAGDAIDTRNGRINLTRPSITADKTAARRSAIRLLELSPAIIAAGHGTPSSSHTSDEIMQLFNTLRQE